MKTSYVLVKEEGIVLAFGRSLCKNMKNVRRRESISEAKYSHLFSRTFRLSPFLKSWPKMQGGGTFPRCFFRVLPDV